MHWWRKQSTNTSAKLGEQYTAHRAKPRRLLSIILYCHLPAHDFYSDYHFDTLQEDVVSRNPCLLKRFSFCDSNVESVFLFERPDAHIRNIQHRQV